MTKTIVAISLILLVSVPVFAGQDVVVVKGNNVAPYENAIRGFQSACGCTFIEMVSAEMGETAVVREIRRIKPRIIFAVGSEALSLAREIKTVPIVYAMVPNPQPLLSEKQITTGVSMNIPPERYLKELSRILPEAKRIGMVYDPAKSGSYAKKAVSAAQLVRGVTLIAKEARTPREVLTSIRDMKGSIDIFWILPDSTVVTPETIEYLIYFSFENKVPVLAFAEKYVDMGAFMSIGIDDFDTGRQAGALVEKALTGSGLRDVQATIVPEKIILSINLRTAKKMSIHLSEEIINGAKVVK